LTSVSASESREKEDLGEPCPFEGTEAMLWSVLLRSRWFDQPPEKMELPNGELEGGR